MPRMTTAVTGTRNVRNTFSTWVQDVHSTTNNTHVALVSARISKCTALDKPCEVTDQPSSGNCQIVRPGVVKTAGSAMQPVKKSTPSQTRMPSRRSGIRESRASTTATRKIDAVTHSRREQSAAKISKSEPISFTRGSRLCK